MADEIADLVRRSTACEAADRLLTARALRHPVAWLSTGYGLFEAVYLARRASPIQIVCAAVVRAAAGFMVFRFTVRLSTALRAFVPRIASSGTSLWVLRFACFGCDTACARLLTVG